MKNIVVIGGGHGLSAILSGIKNIADINISAIVTVANIKYGDKYVSLILATETNQHIFLTYNYNGKIAYADEDITLEEL